MTDSQFCRRLKFLLSDKRDLDSLDIELLNIGRHFIISQNNKYNIKRVIIGRNYKENLRLISMSSEKQLILNSLDSKGPTGIIIGDCNKDDLIFASSIVARYCNKKSA